MQVKLTQTNATVVQMWADLNGVGYSELTNKLIGEACIYFLDGMKASIKEKRDPVEEV